MRGVVPENFLLSDYFVAAVYDRRSKRKKEVRRSETAATK